MILRNQSYFANFPVAFEQHGRDYMAQLALFDYSALDAETRIVVQQKTGEIRDRMKRAAQDMIEIGERLIDVKQRLGHGHFTKWLEAEFDWSEQTARNLMHVSEAFKTTNFVDLKIAPSALTSLAAPSVPQAAREEAIALATNGHSVTHAVAQEIKSRYQAPSSPPRPQIREEDVVYREAPKSYRPAPSPDDFVLRPMVIPQAPLPGQMVFPKIVEPQPKPYVAPSLPMVNLGSGPTEPPDGQPKPTKGWMVATSKLNDVLIFVREQGDISGSVDGWSTEQLTNLRMQLSRFKERLDSWVDYLGRNS